MRQKKATTRQLEQEIERLKEYIKADADYARTVCKERDALLDRVVRAETISAILRDVAEMHGGVTVALLKALKKEIGR